MLNIISIFGNVDAGKTNFLDYLSNKKTKIFDIKEITQEVNYCYISLNTKKQNMRHSFFFFDLPGHDAFIDVKKKIMSISAFSFILIDSTKGFSEEHSNMLDLLKEKNVPFYVLLSKEDLLHSEEQKKKILQNIIYELAKRNYQAESYTKIKNLNEQVPIFFFSIYSPESIDIIIKYLLAFFSFAKIKKKELFEEYFLINYNFDKVNEYFGVIFKKELKNNSFFFNTGSKIKKLEVLSDEDNCFKEKNFLKAPGIFKCILSKEIILQTKEQTTGYFFCVRSILLLDAVRTICKKNNFPIYSISIGTPLKNPFFSEYRILYPNREVFFYLFSAEIDKFPTSIFVNTIYELEQAIITINTQEKKKLDGLIQKIDTFFARAELLPNHIFRTKDPVVLGLKILEGVCHVGSEVYCARQKIGVVQTIRSEEGLQLQSSKEMVHISVSISSTSRFKEQKYKELFFFFQFPKVESEVRNLKKMLSETYKQRIDRYISERK